MEEKDTDDEKTNQDNDMQADEKVNENSLVEKHVKKAHKHKKAKK